MVCTVDGLAAGAGIGALRAGGCAVDAAIAASAVLTVTNQHQCGLGGDLLALVHEPGADRPEALNASGCAGSGAGDSAERLRSAGHEQMPAGRDVACVPVPGCVDGWLALHERFGRLPLPALLAPALAYAQEGFAASEALATASGQIAGLPGAEDFVAPGDDSLRAGQIVRRPGVARVLDAIGRAGRAGFYEGEFGAGLIELGGGEYTEDDLLRVHAEWVEPLTVEAFGRRLWTLPPNSQGYVLLRAAAIACGLPLPEPDDPAWAHVLIEVARVAEADRDEVWHERSDGDALIAEAVIAAMRERVLERTRRAGSGAAPPLPGGTVSLCVVDDHRMAVSMLQSNFLGWGSLLFVPGVGIALHNRGSSFSLRRGHPAEYGPGRRPPHTLTPTLVTDMDGSLQAAVATRGGHIQPQVLLQLLARLYLAGQSPAQALAAGRWALMGERVFVEGQAPDRWIDELGARGHIVERLAPFTEEFGHAQMIVCDSDNLAGASDPRSATWAAATL
jgi:gamma-glutamyltranspeptidase/glutathione hydrolase